MRNYLQQIRIHTHTQQLQIKPYFKQTKANCSHCSQAYPILKSSIQAQNSRIYCGFISFSYNAQSYINILSHIYSQYNQCALCSANLVLLLHAVIYSDRRARQSAILYDCCSRTHMHHQHLILFEPLNTQSLASRSSISSPYHRATQDLQPLPGTPSSYSQLFKDSFNIRPTSHQLHLCVKSPSLATSPSHTTSSSHPTFSQSPEYFTVTKSELKNKNSTSKAALYLQKNSALQPDTHPACR